MKNHTPLISGIAVIFAIFGVVLSLLDYAMAAKDIYEILSFIPPRFVDAILSKEFLTLCFLFSFIFIFILFYQITLKMVSLKDEMDRTIGDYNVMRKIISDSHPCVMHPMIKGWITEATAGHLNDMNGRLESFNTIYMDHKFIREDLNNISKSIESIINDINLLKIQEFGKQIEEINSRLNEIIQTRNKL